MNAGQNNMVDMLYFRNHIEFLGEWLMWELKYFIWENKARMINFSLENMWYVYPQIDLCLSLSLWLKCFIIMQETPEPAFWLDTKSMDDSYFYCSVMKLLRLK